MVTSITIASLRQCHSTTSEEQLHSQSNCIWIMHEFWFLWIRYVIITDPYMFTFHKSAAALRTTVLFQHFIMYEKWKLPHMYGMNHDNTPDSQKSKYINDSGTINFYRVYNKRLFLRLWHNCDIIISVSNTICWIMIGPRNHLVCKYTNPNSSREGVELSLESLLGNRELVNT